MKLRWPFMTKKRYNAEIERVIRTRHAELQSELKTAKWIQKVQAEGSRKIHGALLGIEGEVLAMQQHRISPRLKQHISASEVCVQVLSIIRFATSPA